VAVHRQYPELDRVFARRQFRQCQNDGLGVVSGNGGSLVTPRVAPIAEALAASRFGAPHLVGNAAKILSDRWPSDAPPPFKVDAQAAPDISWVAWLGAAVSPEMAPASPYYLRAPDAKPPKDPLQQASQPAS